MGQKVILDPQEKQLLLHVLERYLIETRKSYFGIGKKSFLTKEESNQHKQDIKSVEELKNKIISHV